MGTRWRFELYGGLCVAQDGQPIRRWEPHKSSSLLAYLAYYHRRALPRDELVEVLWPGCEPQAGRNRLSVVLSELRRQLGKAGTLPDASILADRGSVQLNPDHVTTDVAEFETALQTAARAADDPERADALARTVELYRGELLAGFPDDWILGEREWLSGRYLQALRQLIAHREAAGDLDEALALAHRGVLADPLREEAHRELIRLMAAAGEPAAALRQYTELERMLHEELGAIPDARTRALGRDIERRSILHPFPHAGSSTASSRPAAAFPCPVASPAEGEIRLVAALSLRLIGSTTAAPPAPSEERAARVTRLLHTIADVLLKYEGHAIPPEIIREHLAPRGAAAPPTSIRGVVVRTAIAPAGASSLAEDVLAIFGVPRAREEDVDHAIQAALEIRAGARRLRLEIAAGIDTGEVESGFPGLSPPRREPAGRVPPTSGNGEGSESLIERAARLQRQAQPGQILVGKAAYQRTRGAFEFSLLVSARSGTLQPTGVYAAAREPPRPQRSCGIEKWRAELIGREEDLARLQSTLAEVLQGQGRMVSLIGEAGVGKSRLVSELKLAVPGAHCPVPGEARCPVPGARCPAEGAASAEALGLPPGLPGTGHWAPGTAAEPLWLEGRSRELDTSAGYGVFVDLLRGLFGWRADDGGYAPGGRGAGGERIAATLRALVARGALSDDQYAEIALLLGNLLSARFGNDWDARLKNTSPEQVKYRTCLAICHLLVALAKRRPVVVVLEDLHWADTLSLEVISLLMEASVLSPILLLCVYRPDREHRCRLLGTIAAQKCPDRYTELRLRELTPQQSRQLVRSLLGTPESPAALEELVLEKAWGNPFFVEEVIRTLLDTGWLYCEGTASRVGTGAARKGAAKPGARSWKVREGLVSFALPESIQGLLLSRVDRLEPELRRILQSASVIGRLFPRRLLEYVVAERGIRPDSHPAAPGSGALDRTRPAVKPPTPEALERALEELQDVALIYQERAMPEEEYSFKHGLTQETVYHSIPRGQRSVLHQRVAEGLETLYPKAVEEHYELLAYHYERSRADAKAVEYLLKAGEKARRAYRNEEAIGYFQRTLERLDAVERGARSAEWGIATKAGPQLPATPHSALRTLQSGWRLEALKGLGRVYSTTGRLVAAEECFRQAVDLGRQMGVSAHEEARLGYWLADVLFWQDRHEEAIRIAEAGLQRLGSDTQCVEAALMNDRLAWCHSTTGRGELHRAREFNERNARFLEHLPYSEELRPAYVNLWEMYAGINRTDEAVRWLEALERRAKRSHDLTALAEVRAGQGGIARERGELREAIARLEQSMELLAKTGDTKIEIWILLTLGQTLLALGELPQAAAHATRALEGAKAVTNHWRIASALEVLGTVALCQGSREDAVDAFEHAARQYQEIGDPGHWGISAAGRAYLALGQREKAAQRFREAAALGSSAPPLAIALSGLEEALEAPEAFQSFCRLLREEHPEAGRELNPAPIGFAQWLLEPAEVGARAKTAPTVYDDFANSLSPEWSWHDPLGDSAFRVGAGLVIEAANGRNLWHANLSAPRLLRPAEGEFAVQIVCGPVAAASSQPDSPEKPAIGGLLLWKDAENFFCLARGTRGPAEVAFWGCVGHRGRMIGRGRLPSDRLFLRLERSRQRLEALCSADGRRWFTVGQADVPLEDPLEVGLHAIGAIDRTVYHDAYPEGTAIRFESFRLWV